MYLRSTIMYFYALLYFSVLYYIYVIVLILKKLCHIPVVVCELLSMHVIHIYDIVFTILRHLCKFK